MRKKDDTLRDTLLELARQTADNEGIDAINISSIAKKAGVATGTVYNYFSCKDELLLALTEAYWKQALLEMDAALTADSFCGQLQQIFLFLKERIEQSAGKLMHSLGSTEITGQQRMASMQVALETILLKCLEQDKNICADVWSEPFADGQGVGASFTKEQFVRFVLHNLILLLKAGPSDLAFFFALIRRIIYKDQSK